MPIIRVLKGGILMAQTNFRAEDMPGASKPEAPKPAAPAVPKKKTAPKK